MKVNKRKTAKKALKKKLLSNSSSHDFVEESLDVEGEVVESEKVDNKNPNPNNCVEIENDVTQMELPQDDVQESSSMNKPNENVDKIDKKKRKKGIIYISNIPKHMNVTRIREYLSQYGDIQRVYLQPEKFSLEKQKKKKKRLARHFTEGWVEFVSKRAAKKVPELLNNTNIGTRKKSQFYDSLWSMKYLPRFKWVHLTERMNYEQAVYKQRLRTEVSQARKEATFFQNNLDKSEFLKKTQNKKNKDKNLKKSTQTKST